MFLFALLIVATFVLTVTLKYLRRKERIVAGRPIPKQHGLPVIGQGLEINEANCIYKFEEWAKRHGDIFRFNLWGKNVVVLNSETLVRKAYCTDDYAKYFNDKFPSFYGVHFRFNYDSVVFKPGGRDYEYKQMRKTFMKALHTYGSGIGNLADKVLIEVSNVRSKIDSMKTKEFDFVDFIQRSLANVMSLVLVRETIEEGHQDQTLFWQKAAQMDYFASPCVDVLMTTFPALRFLPITVFGKRFRHSRVVNRQLTEKYFYSKQKEHFDGDDQGIVNFYLEEQRKQKLNGGDVFLTDERIIGQILETIEAGVVTNSSLITSSMLVLLHHPECQTKIQEELDRVIGQGRMPEYADRRNCPYMMAFEREVHRYINVLPLLLPHLCNEDISFEGYNIEKNSLTVANTWFIHHDEKVWGDPWNFRPERFLDERGDILGFEHILMKSVIGFGTGERRCTGETFAKTRYFLYMATLLQSYRFETPEGIKQRSCDPRSVEDFDVKLTIRAKPFMVRAVER